LCSGQPTEKRRSGLATDTLIRVPASMPRKRKGCHGVLPYLTFHEQRTVVPRYTDRWNSGEINRPPSLWPEKLVSFAGSWAHSADYTSNLLISHEQVNQVIDDPRIKGVALTGGVDAARRVAARAGQNVKKTTMELGGSDAFIVLADADLDKTVAWAVWAKMNNTGQCCVAGKRFIVAEELADRFPAKFQASLAELKPGDPMDPATTLAPLSPEAALITLLDQIKRAVAHGATVAMGGKRIDRPGSFMQATILTHIEPANPAFREEFFGPVALFFQVKNEDEAVALANNSDYGLGGSVFTQDIERGKRVAGRIDTGMVFINHPRGRPQTCRLAASRTPATVGSSPVWESD